MLFTIDRVSCVNNYPAALVARRADAVPDDDTTAHASLAQLTLPCATVRKSIASFFVVLVGRITNPLVRPCCHGGKSC